MAKLQYLSRSVMNLLEPARAACPNCGGQGNLVTRKYLVTALKRCDSCKMLFRTPTDTPVEAEKFYNEDYEQGATTSVPTLDELEEMKRDNFPDLECNYSSFASILHDLGIPKGAKVFDYGCSWGYGSYIFRNAGFDVKSFEISRPRGRFGRDHLGVDLAEDFDAFVAANPNSFDVFFSSHVLEHVPSPTRVIEKGFALLKPGGLFVTFVPNGAEAFRRADPDNWMKMWGEVHPNYLDDVYFDALLARRPRLLGSSPVHITPEALAVLGSDAPEAHRLDALKSFELFVAARKVD